MLRPILVTTFAALLLLTPQAPAAVVAEGRFGPTQKYTGTGRAIVDSSGGTRTLRLSRDFSASAAIRLRMYLATTPSARAHIDLGPMTRRGAQSFRLPRSASIRRYPYVVVWCADVDEPVTRARLR